MNCPVLIFQICTAEHQLFHHLFQSAKDESALLIPIMDPLGTILYDVIRPLCDSNPECGGLVHACSDPQG